MTFGFISQNSLCHIENQIENVIILHCLVKYTNNPQQYHRALKLIDISNGTDKICSPLLRKLSLLSTDKKYNSM